MMRFAAAAGFGNVEVGAALTAPGRRLAGVDAAEIDHGLVLGMTCLLTSICARPYGKRAAASRATDLAAPVPEPSGDGGG